ncbi:hypothetical protein D3C71_1766680 [compost metagenome]
MHTDPSHVHKDSCSQYTLRLPWALRNAWYTILKIHFQAYSSFPKSFPRLDSHFPEAYLNLWCIRYPPLMQ